MTQRLERGEGYRFGETTVVSRRVHLVSAERPGEVDIHTGADAGRVFYHRRYDGQVLHLDIFHELAEVDHRQVAQRLRAAAGRYSRQARRPGGGAGAAGEVTLANRRPADYIDIQTATGGGRITGGLSFGQGAVLRRAHQTHVHVALMLSSRDFALVPHLIMAVEEEIARQGYGIRRVERLNHVSGQGKEGSVDLSDYASLSDSLLREPRRDWSSPLGESGASSPSYLRGVLDLADEFGGVEELQEVLNTLDSRPTWSQLHKKLKSRVPLNQVIGRLESEGLLESERGLYSLTPNGRILHDYVTSHRKDIDLRFKLTLRRLPFSGRPSRKPSVPTAAVRSAARGRVNYRRVEPAEAGGWVGALAAPETVTQMLRRNLGRGGPGDPGGPGGDVPARSAETGRPAIRREDVLVYRRRGLGPLDVCLVIDASASMAGPRMRAAKYLAQHLLLSTRDRVSVIVFQEREAGLYVPFTRNFEAVDGGLRRIRPLGLTPLAEGLIQAARYVRKERARDPLLLLITDGIPTVPKWSMNPVADAQEAACRLAREKVRFSCVGLEPNRDFLRDLAAAARGTLHVVDELEQTLLSEIAHSERRRLRL
jgi:magnesium chelatase subunit D